ncbi:MAG: cytochrome d ubiquinol oxidase subunit II, partial [Verrucomicrobiae bacterium]|nr:cytochrome d ubiquinol oxidase subunit II [Verrucomicrobiae bacterium]
MLAEAIALVMLVALLLYALLAGADFGGGVWDLLAFGPRASKQRQLIARAIGPIWEANHVWLILIIVLMFTCFPVVFAALSIALHIPFMMMLIGIVLRGSAFAFRSYDERSASIQQRWGAVFAIASAFTPILLGVCLGAVTAGPIFLPDSRFPPNFLSSWTKAFPWAVGMFTLALFSFLAAIY